MINSREEARRKIAPIILAAGDSSRMGFPKALLPLGMETFLTQILGVLNGFCLADPVIVLGSHAKEILDALGPLPGRIVINSNPEKGQLSSIKLALDQLDAATAGCLIWPVDQPAVSSNVVEGLVQLFLQTYAPLVLPTYEGKRGHPTIIHSALFPEFLAASLEEGPKNIILSRLKECALLPTAESAVIEDIDTPADYFKLTGVSIESALAGRGKLL
jgi:molybdenum cofactor cytidylyltransferase